MGYSLIAFSTSNYIGVQMVLFYMMISGLSIWSIFLLLKLKKNSAFAKYNKELGDFVLLKKSNPTMSFALLLTMFSIAGNPSYDRDLLLKWTGVLLVVANFIL